MGSEGLLDIECKWLPGLVLLEDFQGNWHEFEEYIYKIFKKDFIDDKPLFNNKQVNYRKHPVVCEKEQAFFHITHKNINEKDVDLNDREPDLRRCERIKWPRSIIENYDCDENCNDCNKIKLWKKPYKNYYRIHLLFQDVRYLLVLEERDDYILLITGFYLEQNHTLRKKLKEYEKYKTEQFQ